MGTIRNRFLIIVICMQLLGVSNLGYSQGLEKYHALLTFKLSDYFLWPDNPEVKTIGVFGNSKVTLELEKIANTKSNKKVKIVKINSLAEIAKCNIVFLPMTQNNIFGQLLKETQKGAVVLVTEAGEFAAKGASISFYELENRMKMRLNKSAVESLNIKISSGLLSVVEVI